MSTEEKPYACPNCGTRVGAVRNCPTCGMDFAAPRPQQQAPPPGYAQPAQPVRPQAAPAAGLTAMDLPGLLLAVGGALLALLASFLPWVSLLGIHRSYWQISDAQDIFLLLFVLAAIGVSAAVLLSPGTRVLRLVALALTAGLVDFVFAHSIEFMARDEPGFGTHAGEVFGLLAAIVLIAAVVLQVIGMRSGPAEQGLHPLTMIGLIAIGAAGLLQPLVELLSVDSGFSQWEVFKAADVIRALIGLATAGLAVAAVVTPRLMPLMFSVFALGSYTATDNLIGSIEELATPSRGAEVFVSLLLLAPIGIGGVVLVAAGYLAQTKREVA